MNIRKAIEKNEAEQRRLKAQRAVLLSDERKKDRKLLARQKIILGGWILSNDPTLVRKIVSLLDREQDREVFSLISSMSEEPDLSAFSRVDIPLPIGDGQAASLGTSIEFGIQGSRDNTASPAPDQHQ